MKKCVDGLSEFFLNKYMYEYAAGLGLRSGAAGRSRCRRPVKKYASAAKIFKKYVYSSTR